MAEELEPQEAPLEGIIHPPGSPVPYLAAMDSAIRDLADQAEVPPLLLGLEES